jgi:hypothetical protein
VETGSKCLAINWIKEARPERDWVYIAWDLGKEERMKKLKFVGLLAGCFAIATWASPTAQGNSTQSQESQESSQAGISATVPGEPTSQEMRAAVQATVDSYNDSMKQKITACRNGQYDNNPVMAAQCLAVYAGGSNGKSDYMIKITKFKKISCASAQPVGKPGYNCDYSITLSENTPALLGTLGINTQSGGTTEGRFVRTENGWTLITDTSR